MSRGFTYFHLDRWGVQVSRTGLVYGFRARILRMSDSLARALSRRLLRLETGLPIGGALWPQIETVARGRELGSDLWVIRYAHCLAIIESCII